MQSCPKISVVIPIYNGSSYIGETLDSLLKQKFMEFEVICVDDCSTDNSKEIINSYSAMDKRVLCFSTMENLGIVPKVLNYALKFAKGDYFVYSSQDDLFSTDWLQSMYEKALDSGADAVIPDLVFYYKNKPEINRLLSGVDGDKERILTNREAFLYSLEWKIPGNALWNINLFKKFGYFDFGMNADEYTARVYFLNSNKVVFSNGTFFYRQDNVSAITKKETVKSFDIPYTDLMLWELVTKNEFPQEVKEKLLIRSVVGIIYYRSRMIVNRGLAGGGVKVHRFIDEFKRRGADFYLKECKAYTWQTRIIRVFGVNIYCLSFVAYISLFLGVFRKVVRGFRKKL